MDVKVFSQRSLKTRATLFTLAIFVLGIWSLAFYASRLLREEMRPQLSEQQFSSVSLVAGDINDELDVRLRALESTAARISPATVRDTGAGQALLEDRPIFSAMFNGGVFITRLDGMVTASMPVSAGRIGLYYGDRSFMIATLETGKTTINRPSIGKTQSAPVFAMATPIRDAQGKVIGVLAGTTDLSKPSFLDKLAGSHYGKTGGYLLVDSQHRMVVTATDKQAILREFPAPGVSPVIDRFIAGYEGSDIFINPGGQEVLASVKGVPVAGWQLVAELPTQEAFSAIDTKIGRAHV